MPMYSTVCSECGASEVKKLSFAEHELISEQGMSIPCTCGKGVLSIQFNPGDVGFILKEGPSGGWVTKSMKENKYRARRAEVMAKREKDHVHKSNLVPNYGGQEANSWKEVQEHVRSEKGDLSASTYEPLVKREIAK